MLEQEQVSDARGIGAADAAQHEEGGLGAKGLVQLRISLMTVTLMIAMDQTILATAVPAIIGSLGGAAQLGWVFTSYTLGMTLAMPITGRLADLRGRRRLFLLCVAGFALSSLVCGFATTMPQFLGARFIQGLAGGGIGVLSQAVIADAVAPRHRARFSAPIGSMFAVASVIAPLVGGALTDTVGWRWIFWINVPLGLSALAFAVRSVPRVRVFGEGRFDAVGAVLLSLFLAGAVFVAEAAAARSGHPVLTTVEAAVTVLALLGYLLRVRRSDHPLIPVQMFRNRTVVICATLSFVLGLAVFGLIGFMPGLMQAVFGLSASASGMVILPMVIGIIGAGYLSGVLVSRTGRYRRLPVLGALIAGAGMAGLAALQQSSPTWQVAICVFGLGVGVGTFGQLTLVAIQNSLPHNVVASATATAALVRELGVAVGAAVLGGLLATGLSQRLGADAALADLGPAQLATRSAADRALYVEAYLHSFTPIAFGLMVLFGLAVLVALFLPDDELPDRRPAV